MPNNPVIPVLLASVTALLALLAGFGGADGARRNHEWLLFGAVVIVVIALVVGGVTAIVNQKDANQKNVSWWLRGTAILGVCALATGLVVAAWASLDHHSGRPEISAALIASPSDHIVGTITRDGLAAKDQMEATVEAYSTRNAARRTRDKKRALVATLYRASFGPDESGKATLNFEVPVRLKNKNKNKNIRSILVRTWVLSTNKPPNLSCSTLNKTTITKSQAGPSTPSPGLAQSFWHWLERVVFGSPRSESPTASTTGSVASAVDTSHFAACVLFVLRP